uniref:Uncharacterized protein n=1 Tax=Physcomitrium patens TaxID=3218 RepID=A0A2K1JZK5_PHYPA|nr:hypothetical protein PHYPA_014070 [Physcomitrium patens]
MACLMAGAGMAGSSSPSLFSSWSSFASQCSGVAWSCAPISDTSRSFTVQASCGKLTQA